MKYMTVGLKRRVSVALLPIDDFTGRIITGSRLRVYTRKDNIASLRKPDGYHIFCDLMGSEVEICLEGPLYQKQILRLPIGYEEPIIRQVRMIPGPACPLPDGTTFFRGTLPKGSVFRLFCSSQKRSCRLLYDYDPLVQKEELSLFRPYEISLEGKTLCISDQENDLEFIRVSDQRSDTCILERPLSRPYQRADARVYPVHEAAAGEDGKFYLPVFGPAGKEVCVCILTEADGKQHRWEITPIAGEENLVTEEMWKEEM